MFYYNTITCGVLEYYKLSNNRGAVRRVLELMKFSCASTLSCKFELRSPFRAFYYFGRALRDSSTGAEFYALEPLASALHSAQLLLPRDYLPGIKPKMGA